MRNIYRAAAVLACLALAAGTLAGCAPAVPPASSSVPAQTGEETDNPLHDGRLRYLYSMSGSGGGSLLRGDELLYRASPSERITLLYAPGVEAPAGWQLDRNDENGQRVAEVYNAAGNLLWSGPGEWRASLAGTMLALEPGSSVDVGPDNETGCRLIDTATGQEYALPAEASGCIPTENGQAVLTLNTDPAAGGLEGNSVVVLDLATGEEMYRVERSYAYRAYGFDGVSRCAALQRYDPAAEQWSTDLYDPASRTMYTGFQSFCGPDVLCCQAGPGQYDVFRLGESEPLASYSGLCSYWQDGLALAQDAAGGTVLYTPDGEARPLLDFMSYSTSGPYAAFLLEDGTLLLCGPDGAETAVETDLAGQQDRVLVGSAQGGCALITVSDQDYLHTRSLVYDASGLLYDSEGSGYERLNYLTMGPDGPVYEAARQETGSAWLSDLLDSRGNVLLSRLADVSWGGDLPDGVIAARRGFERGYMDLAGNWLYSESVFNSLEDEDASYYG